MPATATMLPNLIKITKIRKASSYDTNLSDVSKGELFSINQHSQVVWLTAPWRITVFSDG